MALHGEQGRFASQGCVEPIKADKRGENPENFPPVSGPPCQQARASVTPGSAPIPALCTVRRQRYRADYRELITVQSGADPGLLYAMSPLSAVSAGFTHRKKKGDRHRAGPTSVAFTCKACSRLCWIHLTGLLTAVVRVESACQAQELPLRPCRVNLLSAVDAVSTPAKTARRATSLP